MNDDDNETDPYDSGDSPWGDSSRREDPPIDEDDAGDAPLAGLAQAAAVAAPVRSWQGRGPALDAAGRIDDDTNCKACGYNLRGQSLDNTCPECGASVEWSARGDRLAYHDPRWLGALSRGTLWLIISIIVGIVLGIANAIVAIAIAMNQVGVYAPQPGTQPTFGPQQVGALQNTIAFIIALISSALYLYAIWQLTVPEPSRRDESPVSSRNLVRWGSAAYVGFIILGNMVNYATPIAGGVVVLIGMVAGLVAFFATFIYLRGLALRAPDMSLASQTRLVMWGLVGSIGLYLVTLVLMFVFAATMFSGAGPGGGSAGGAVVGIFTIGGGCLSGLGMLVFGIWAFVLLFFYRACFRTAEQQALASR